MRRALLAAILLLAVLPPRHAASQVPFDACRDRNGQVIPGIVDNSIFYAGIAEYQNGRPVILWNAKTNQHLSSTEQIFIYLHECAHHTLGHPFRNSDDARSELEADCWAIQLMVDGGMIKGRHLAELERSRKTVRGDAAHLGGDAHVRSLHECHCEVVGPALRCMLFAARKENAAMKRFDELVHLIHAWLPVGWTSVERPAGAAGGRIFLAQDGSTGTLITLAQSGARVHLLVKRVPV